MSKLRLPATIKILDLRIIIEEKTYYINATLFAHPDTR